jgi:hypothetical protein
MRLDVTHPDAMHPQRASCRRLGMIPVVASEFLDYFLVKK